MNEEIRRAAAGESFFLRLLLTVLFSSRAFSLNLPADLRSITDPHLVGIRDISESVSSFWMKELRVNPQKKRVPSVLSFKKYHFTTKTGPNGHAISTSLLDLYTIADRFPDLLEDIMFIGGEKLRDNMVSLLPLRELFYPMGVDTASLKIRKLSSFPDKEMKQRTIAILDY